ncbi:MAG TPA: hypothetical protein PLK23_02265 [Clostridia bacterium]|jgi:hypothetical protein|nr:hypothetical protein [Clostridiaceae bacterium]HOF26051.1 hypothetical protein [Clostridia bacterium]HOM33506.1 hypothetical protein [Clostridia bacterium]HOR89228.1 hypothetical protein [Clostridia bacterium]HPL07389.1 hypothetical protein [Clostridia bacterium]
MVKIHKKKNKGYILPTLITLCIVLQLSACNKNSPSPYPTTTVLPSATAKPTQSEVAEQTDFVQLDMLMQYQHGVQVLPAIYDTRSITLEASDGYQVKLYLIQVNGQEYPVYNGRENETLNSPLIAIPDTEGKQYLLCNQHKIYLVDLSVPVMDILLSESDETTTYRYSLENNRANGLYWGTKPVLSEDGRFLLYLTNRRNNGKTNDIRLYDFESKEDVLLAKDAYYNRAYISDTTVFYTCNDMLCRIEIPSKVKATVSVSVSPNGHFCYPYYIYTADYYQKYEILNILSLNVEKGSLGIEKSALKIVPMKTDTDYIAAVLLLNRNNVTLSFIDIKTNKLLKTFVLSDSFRVVYTQWIDDNTFLVSGYEGGDNEKTYLLSY